MLMPHKHNLGAVVFINIEKNLIGQWLVFRIARLFTEVLFLPVVSSPLFSVFGLNPKGPEAFFSALFFVR